jgi:arylsulfatase A-like enzyme
MKLRHLAMLAALLAPLPLAGCSGDDTSVPLPDAGGKDAGAAGDATTGTPQDDGGSRADASPDASRDAGADATPAEAARRVIVFVWDGLRPDSVTATDTPNLHALGQAGVRFDDNHSTYPTFTMMNAASFATGGFPGTTGFYGNTLYEPGTAQGRPAGNDSAGKAVDFGQPVFTEDYAILQDLEAYYEGQLFLVKTLFDAAHKAGLTTAAIGKSGPAFLQDEHKGGYIVDEKAVFPQSLASELQSAGFPLPRTTPLAYASGAITLAGNNGDPTAGAPRKNLADNATGDPTDTGGSPSNAANQYLLSVYRSFILPRKKPDLSLIWLRSPDSTEHTYGPGTANYRDALRAQDALLGQLQATLADLGLASTTDIVVVSDHGHSSVSGPASLFPLRAVTAGAAGAKDPGGYSVSGDVRLADLMTRAGFIAFDGNGCTFDPVLSGIKDDGSQVYATRQDDAMGTACGASYRFKPSYTTGSFLVPAALPARAIVIAANGGSDYLYVPDHDADTVKRAVAFLQSREEVGAIFVSKRFAPIPPGTLAMESILVESTAGRNPDVIMSYAFDENAVVAGMKGTELESMQTNRGMHGSFSPVDVHNTLVAFGPHFRRGLVDSLPTGNVDVAPTVASILGVALPGANGRPLLESLAHGGATMSDYLVEQRTVAPASPATGLIMKLPTSPAGADVDTTRTSYTIELQTKVLRRAGETFTYFDYARAVRK